MMHTITIPEAIRREARKRYDSLAWPSPREEEWRRTDITSFAFDSYTPRRSSDAAVDDAGSRATAPLPGAPGVTGSFAAVVRFSGTDCVEATVSPSAQAAGLEVLRIESGGAGGSNGRMPLEELTGERGFDNRIEAWHYAEALHGVVVRVKAGAIIDDPILVDYLEDGDGVLTNPHLYVVLDEGASATVAEYHRTGGGRILGNRGAHLELRSSSSLRMVSISDLGDETTVFDHRSASLGDNSSLDHFSAIFGGKLVKSKIRALLAGSTAGAELNGAYLGIGKSHYDIRTVQEHAAPGTRSRAFYKGAVRDSARTIFQGLIDVDKRATMTDAYLSNKNLVLNDGARADSIPSLEIRTNDVRCSHGSTTGRIDDDQIFYLMSRGFSERDAKRAILEGYFEDVVRLLPEAFRDDVMERIGREIDRVERKVS